MFMRRVAALASLLLCSVALPFTVDNGTVGPAEEHEHTSNLAPQGIQLFDLHQPGLMSSWATFLATTPMLNEEPLPPSLQRRLADVVATYRLLTPVDRPAFFVATYVDLLSERLLAVDPDQGRAMFPLQVCPVFASGDAAPVSSLLAEASGLPDELFVNAPGQPEHYRYLFLQTEYSHCRFLASIKKADEPALAARAGGRGDTTLATLSFTVGVRPYTAILGTKEELRALLETVGDIDAIAMFKRQRADRSPVDEADVLRFVRLLALLGTDARNGYAAIPVLLPLLNDDAEGVNNADVVSFRIADALELAYEARAAFRRTVPFSIRDTGQLHNARLAVARALAAGGEYRAVDRRIRSLLHQFVAGSNLLLATTVETERMPPTNDQRHSP
jgi:hypothetical protein